MRHRLEPAGEVGAGRRGDDAVGHLRGGAHPEERLGGEHERPQVEAGLAAVARAGTQAWSASTRARSDPVKSSSGRSGRASRRAMRANRAAFGLGPERPDRAVGVPVGLHALEDLLRVVQHRGRGLQRDRPVRRDLAVVPAPVGGPGGQHHVVGEGLAEPGVGEDRLALLVRQRVRAPLHGELEGGLGQCRAAVIGASMTRDGFTCRLPLPARHARVGVFASATARRELPRRAGEPEAGSGQRPGCGSDGRAAMASPISAVLRTASPRSARSAATARSTRAASSVRPRCSSSIATDRIVAVGSALPWPAMSGAEPCTGSNMLGTVRVGVDVAAGGQADATGDGRRDVGDDVAEEVVGDDDVEPAGVGGQEDRGRVDVQVVGADLGELAPRPPRRCGATGGRRGSARCACAPG